MNTGYPTTPTPAKKPSSKVLKIVLLSVGGGLAVVALAIAGIFVATFLATVPPVEVSNKFVNSFQDKDVSATYELASPEFKRVTSEQRLKAFMDSSEGNIDGDEAITNRKVIIRNDKTYGVVTYEVKQDNTTRYSRVTVIKDNDQWLVLNIRVADKPFEAILE